MTLAARHDEASRGSAPCSCQCAAHPTSQDAARTSVRADGGPEDDQEKKPVLPPFLDQVPLLWRTPSSASEAILSSS
jgi:hypothetical protein